MHIPQPIYSIMTRLNDKHKSFLVGGCVRDYLLKREVTDYDIITTASLDEVQALFPKVINLGKKYGTLTVIIDNIICEISSINLSEKTSSAQPNQVRVDVKHPYESLKNNLLGRDLTINSLAMDIAGNIYDYSNGQKDLNERMIKINADTDKILQEDPLRLMRFIRFSCQLGFYQDGSCCSAILKNSHLIKNPAKERISSELIKILLSDYPAKGIEQLMHLGLLKYIIPELADCYNFAQQSPYHDKDVFQHSLAVLTNTPAKLSIRLAALFHDIAKPVTFSIGEGNIGHFYRHQLVGAEMSKEILRNLRFDNQTIEKVNILIKEHMHSKRFSSLAEAKRFINRVGKDNLNDLFTLQKADKKATKPPYDYTAIEFNRILCQDILASQDAISLQDLAINGYDLMELGIEAGPQLGLVLEELLNQVIENPDLNQRSKLLLLAQKLIK